MPDTLFVSSTSSKHGIATFFPDTVKQRGKQLIHYKENKLSRHVKMP